MKIKSVMSVESVSKSPRKRDFARLYWKDELSLFMILLIECETGDESANAFICFPSWNVTGPDRRGNSAAIIAHSMHAIPTVSL